MLEQGKLLVLMDGLDEVPTHGLRRKVESQIKQVSEKYSIKNRFILTCRTQIMGAIPNSFASVEVADFNSEQINQFVLNWFLANGKSALEATQQCQLMKLAISRQPDLGEVTTTPVLLSLICVVLQDNGEIPTNRTNLYRRGISLLLRSWNNKKNIEGWELGTEQYRRLSFKDKKSLLTEIAARKFENPKNFVLFEQDELVGQISKKLKLASAQEGHAVLKAIEAQHGLLIERADELWSFSHLTFQEYFTVQWLTQLPPKQLADKIANQQWQKSVEQLVKSQQPADRLLYLIKQAIDQLIARESTIQTFLKWLLEKSNSLKTSYQPAAIRAFYYSLTLDPTLDRYLARDRYLALDIDLDNDLDRDRSRYLDLDRYGARGRYSNVFVFDSDRSLEHAIALDRALYLALDSALSLAHSLSLSRILLTCCRNRSLARDHARDCDRALVSALDSALDLDYSPDLSNRIYQLRKKLPTLTRSNKSRCWWILYGNRWTEQMRQLIISYRNIGHDWQFTQEQQQQLQRYYETNRFLVNLTRIKGAVSEACRTDIEGGLLLPWAELQRRQPNLYGDITN